MITPVTSYGNATPVQAAYDPLRVSAYTGGFGTMPSAQYLTPAGYGAYRQLPGANMSITPNMQPGFFGNASIAMHMPFTYNPAVNPMVYRAHAARRMADTASMFGVNALGFGTDIALGLGASALAGGGAFGMMAGIAAPMLLPVGGIMANSIADRMREARALQMRSMAKITSGRDLDLATGMGFSGAAAAGIDRFIRRQGARDFLFKEGDYRNILNMGMEAGLFDYAGNNAEQYKRQLKMLRNTFSTAMSVLGSTDFKEILKDLKRLQNLGATTGQMGTLLRREEGFARMAGMSHADMVSTYGQAGAVMATTRGLSGITGSLASMGHAAAIRIAQQNGLVGPSRLAAMGGESGYVTLATESSLRSEQNMEKLIAAIVSNDRGNAFDFSKMEAFLDRVQRGETDLVREAANAKAGMTAVAMQNLEINSGELHKKFRDTLGESDYRDFKIKMYESVGKLLLANDRTATRLDKLVAGYRAFTGADAREAAITMRSALDPSMRAQEERSERIERIRRREEERKKNTPLNRFSVAVSKFVNSVSDAFTNPFVSNIAQSSDRFASRSAASVWMPNISLADEEAARRVMLGGQDAQQKPRRNKTALKFGDDGKLLNTPGTGDVFWFWNARRASRADKKDIAQRQYFDEQVYEQFLTQLKESKSPLFDRINSSEALKQTVYGLVMRRGTEDATEILKAAYDRKLSDHAIISRANEKELELLRKQNKSRGVLAYEQGRLTPEYADLLALADVASGGKNGTEPVNYSSAAFGKVWQRVLSSPDQAANINAETYLRKQRVTAVESMLRDKLNVDFSDIGISFDENPSININNMTPERAKSIVSLLLNSNSITDELELSEITDPRLRKALGTNARGIREKLLAYMVSDKAPGTDAAKRLLLNEWNAQKQVIDDDFRTTLYSTQKDLTKALADRVFASYKSLHGISGRDLTEEETSEAFALARDPVLQRILAYEEAYSSAKDANSPEWRRSGSAENADRKLKGMRKEYLKQYGKLSDEDAEKYAGSYSEFTGYLLSSGGILNSELEVLQRAGKNNTNNGKLFRDLSRQSNSRTYDISDMLAAGQFSNLQNYSGMIAEYGNTTFANINGLAKGYGIEFGALPRTSDEAVAFAKNAGEQLKKINEQLKSATLDPGRRGDLEYLQSFATSFSTATNPYDIVTGAFRSANAFSLSGKNIQRKPTPTALSKEEQAKDALVDASVQNAEAKEGMSSDNIFKTSVDTFQESVKLFSNAAAAFQGRGAAGFGNTANIVNMG